MTDCWENEASPSWPPVSSELCRHCPASFPQTYKAYGEKVIFVPRNIYFREGKVFCILSLTLGGGGEDCNQVSWSQFSQLHIIIWFRYLIHALKLKTCLELTNALLSHRLQRGTYHLPISSYWPRHGPWVETLCPEHYKKRKRNKKVKWKCLHLAFFCVWWFFFSSKS